MNNLLTEKEAAQYLGVKTNTLAVWRCTRRYNIPYYKVGHIVRYKPEDLELWLCAQSRK